MRKKQIHNEKEVCQFKQKLRLSSCSTVSSNSQSCGATDLFVDTLATSIPPQHKVTWLMRVLVLPRTLPHIYATRAVCVFPFSFRVGVLWLVKELIHIF